MNLIEMRRAVHKELGGAATHNMIDVVFAGITRVVFKTLKEGGEIPVFGIGKVKSKKQLARKGVSALTGKSWSSPEKKTVAFSVFASFKKILNNK